MRKVEKIEISKKLVNLLLAGGLALVIINNQDNDKEKLVHINNMTGTLEDKMHDYNDVLQIDAKKNDNLVYDNLIYIGRYEYSIPPRNTSTSFYRYVSPNLDGDGYYYDLYEFIDNLVYIGRYEYSIPPRDTSTSFYRYVSPNLDGDGYYYDLYKFIEKENKLR